MKGILITTDKTEYLMELIEEEESNRFFEKSFGKFITLQFIMPTVHLMQNACKFRLTF